ncbi:hypothetical protein AA101099_1512 [Neoasaia chiangmaiensis NBRC 101099]|nr:hypothetical protein AA101099_1512 [Neoasaia chiangmaiensis NBRC 101099]
MLAADWLLAVRREGRALTNRPPACERESAEPLPAGHPVSWSALWGTDEAARRPVPRFPGLPPIGALEARRSRLDNEG